VGVDADVSARLARSGRRTCFDLLRLGAAVAVLLSHSYAVVGRSEPGLGHQSLGNIAVLVFFGISGYLIAQSWQAEPRLTLFAVKRALRILPALLAVLLLSALVIGPLVTGVSVGDYLSSTATWRYVADNAVMHTTYGLPGVFSGNPLPGIVNGSLWTLKHEVLCYLLVAGLGVAGLLRRRGAATAVLLALIGLFAVAGGHGPAFFDASTLERAFFVAALLAVWGDKVPWSAPLAVIGLAAWLALEWTAAGPWMATLAIPYATITAAGLITPAAERFLRGNDVSYGVYLWAFPVQQLLVSAWTGVSPLALSAVALPLTILVALGSWLVVEKPALALKSRVARRLRGTGAPAAAAPAPVVVAEAPEPAPVHA
jgi:peptidoglycan/LPS O-acetylase OafA/YrhL